MNKIIETYNYLTIVQVCGFSYKYSQILCIIGYPGAGKTTTLTDIVSKNENVFYVAATETKSAKQLFIDILVQLNEEASPDDNLNKIIAKIAFLLNVDSKKKLIIVDECTYLKSLMLSNLKELMDATRETTGLVLAGPYNYKDSLESWAKKDVKGIGEFLSRIWDWQTLVRPKPVEINAFLKEYNIKDQKFANYLKKIVKSFRQLVYEIEKYNFKKAGEDLSGILVT